MKAKKIKFKDVEKPIWSKIEVTEKAIQSAAKSYGMSEEESFDFLLDLLEHGEKAWLEGIEHTSGVYLYRIEKDYLRIKENKLIHCYREKRYPKHLRFKVHKAEDGRCEECGRPMDKKAAYIKPLDETIINKFRNYALLCPDCFEGAADPLEEALISEVAITAYQIKRGNTFEEAKNELLITRKNLVLLQVKENVREYWAPRLGIFFLIDGVLYLKQVEESPVPVLERKPQERSRRWESENDNESEAG